MNSSPLFISIGFFLIFHKKFICFFPTKKIIKNLSKHTHHPHAHAHWTYKPIEIYREKVGVIQANSPRHPRHGDDYRRPRLHPTRSAHRSRSPPSPARAER